MINVYKRLLVGGSFLHLAFSANGELIASPTVSRLLPEGIYLNSETLENGQRVCRFTDGVILRFEKSNKLPCFTKMQNYQNAQEVRYQPRVLPNNVFVKRELNIGDGSKVCQFTDGLTANVPIASPCFTRAISSNSVTMKTATTVSPRPVSEQKPFRPYQSLSKNNLCRQMKAARKSGSGTYPEYISELQYRGLNEDKCAVQWGKILLGVAAAAAVVAVATSGGGGGGGSSFVPTSDSSFQWDLQNSSNGGVGWVCRGEQTGQYAENSHCEGKLMTDQRWPGLGQ